MSFADYCLFATAATILQGPGVTMSFACEFLDAAFEGELIEGRTEVTRAGKSVLFMRGMLTSAERPVLTFSGTIKRVNRNIPTIIPE
jgi:acyl-coenzyme A thioesterase PaaI-like protein